MKEGIHPKYKESTISCICGNKVTTKSTRGDMHVEICAACHPLYTGKQKIVDTAGRVERFNKKYGMSNDEAPEKTDEAPVKAEAATKKADKAPEKAEATPVKDEAAPVKAEAKPEKADAAPEKTDAAPEKADTEPVKADAEE